MTQFEKSFEDYLSPEDKENFKQDLSKSHTAKLLHEILDLCLETKTELDLFFGVPPSIRIWFYIDKDRQYSFTLDGDNPELEQAKQDLLAYKKGLNK